MVEEEGFNKMVETVIFKGGFKAPDPVVPARPSVPSDPTRVSNAGTRRKKVGIVQTILGGLNLGGGKSNILGI